MGLDCTSAVELIEISLASSYLYQTKWTGYEAATFLPLQLTTLRVAVEFFPLSSLREDMILLPNIEGELTVRSSANQFSAALQQRIARGFLFNRSGPRQNYELAVSSSMTANVRAANWLTAISVGMNELFLDLSESGKINFRLSYWRWTSYCVGLGAILGLVMIVLFLVLDIRQYIANNPQARIPGLTITQNVYFAWSNIVFWGYIWPWILVGLHKRPLRKLLAKTIAEIDDEAIAKYAG